MCIGISARRRRAGGFNANTRDFQARPVQCRVTGNIGEASRVLVAPWLTFIRQEVLNIKQVHYPLLLFRCQVSEIGANGGNQGAQFVSTVACRC
jgi:hypothetical protein